MPGDSYFLLTLGNTCAIVAKKALFKLILRCLQGKPMSQRELLLGDEAVALAAIHAGISGAYSYPGTPATEVFEFIETRAKQDNILAVWTANEKVAYEAAVGMSFAGKKSIVSMKHVGLNVAMDPFMSSALTGAHGELVLCVADDPGMHSSQNEQDTRCLAKFALLPCLEPSNQQEAYDMTREAFRISKEIKTPVVIRITTRLAHSRSVVITGEPWPQNPLAKITDPTYFTLLPSLARPSYKKLTEKQTLLAKWSEESQYNELNLAATDKTIGIITTGIAWNYTREAFAGKVPYPYLKISMYPQPVHKIKALIEAVSEIYIVEEGYPVVEEAVRGIVGVSGKKIYGKLDHTLPRTGELNPNIVAKAFKQKFEVVNQAQLQPVPGRPPALCKGCPHADSFTSIKEALASLKAPNASIFSDIGCYTLGFYPPYNALESCIEMGGSIGMAIGAADAGLSPIFSVIGDSTFGHSGMTALLTAVHRNLNIKVAILDNSIVAMTGQQESLSSGPRLEQIVAGLGVDPKHIRILTPLAKNKEENIKIILDEVAYPGLSVLIYKRPCIQIKKQSLSKE